MKQYLILIICCFLGVALQAQTQPSVPETDLYLRDSIFQVFHSMAGDTAKRVQFMRDMLQKNISKKWSVELLDSTLVLVTDSNYREEEVSLHYDYYRHYKYLADTAQMNKAFRKLETVSKKYQMYNLYFTAWGDILQFSTVRGDTEYVLLEAQRIEEEARKLDNATGIYYSLLTTARALRASKQEEKAVEKYREALEIPSLSKINRATVYNEISTIYLLHEEYDKTLSELNMQRSMMEQALKENPKLTEEYRDKLLDMELSYCSVYLDLSELDTMLIHLKQAQKYFSSNTLFSYKIKYHLIWAGYYCMRGQWDKSFSEYDTALSLFDDTQPLFKMTVRIIKGNALKIAKRYREAADNYRIGVLEMDSLNRDVLRLHEEAHQANFIIRQALLERAKAERRYNLILATLVIIFIVVLVILLMRAIYVRRFLLCSEQETREALQTVEAANKMKEVFLRNITSQIREPLNLVVGFAELLSTEKGLTKEQMQEYATLMKKSADQLSQLIFDVLDLSRLESGMMKFTLEDCDAVQLCRDAKMAVEMQIGNAVHLEFRTKLEMQKIQTDQGRFMCLLISVLSAPAGYKGLAVVEYELTGADDILTITVLGSPLLATSVEGASSGGIKHDINRLFLETFGGTYHVTGDGGKKQIIMTYPCLK